MAVVLEQMPLVLVVAQVLTFLVLSAVHHFSNVVAAEGVRTALERAAVAPVLVVPVETMRTVPPHQRTLHLAVAVAVPTRVVFLALAVLVVQALCM